MSGRAMQLSLAVRLLITCVVEGNSHATVATVASDSASKPELPRTYSTRAAKDSSVPATGGSISWPPMVNLLRMMIFFYIAARATGGSQLSAAAVEYTTASQMLWHKQAYPDGRAAQAIVRCAGCCHVDWGIPKLKQKAHTHIRNEVHACTHTHTHAEREREGERERDGTAP